VKKSKIKRQIEYIEAAAKTIAEEFNMNKQVLEEIMIDFLDEQPLEKTNKHIEYKITNMFIDNTHLEVESHVEEGHGYHYIYEYTTEGLRKLTEFEDKLKAILQALINNLKSAK